MHVCVTTLSNFIFFIYFSKIMKVLYYTFILFTFNHSKWKLKKSTPSGLGPFSGSVKTMRATELDVWNFVIFSSVIFKARRKTEQNKWKKALREKWKKKILCSDFTIYNFFHSVQQKIRFFSSIGKWNELCARAKFFFLR